MIRTLARWVVWGLWAVLAGCGGGEDSPSAPATGVATVGADGGKVFATTAEVLVPPGALTDAATIRIAADSAGSPALPPWARPAGEMLSLTPHGSTFAEPVTVRLRAPSVTLAANERLYIAKAQPGGEWEVLTDTELNNGHLEVKVQSFSFFVPVVVQYVNVLTAGFAQPLPFALSPLALECDGRPCVNPERVRTMTITISASGNGGLVPAGCVDPSIQFQYRRSDGTGNTAFGSRYPVTSALAIRLHWQPPVDALELAPFNGTPGYEVRASMRCVDAVTNAASLLYLSRAQVVTDSFPNTPSTPSIKAFPSQVTAAVGEQRSLRATLSGGASFRRPQNGTFAVPTGADQAAVTFERLGPGESGWAIVTTSLQTGAANHGGTPWMYWGFDYPLGPFTLADNGTRYRIRACYARPGGTTQCTIGPVATLTLLAAANAPSFTLQPASLLIQPGQTASFTALVGGAPQPTLQWQTRPPGSTGAWTNVAAGAGATSANHTTPALQLADNGSQYRLLATNSAGSATSDPVTVSVSANTVAPSIGTQPMSLAVVTGSHAVFAVTASGTAPLSYQWSRNGVPMAGANGAQLLIAQATAADAGTFHVTVSNNAGSVTSLGTVLDVNALPNPAPVVPSIVTQPAAVAVTEGNVATFGVGVAGSGPLSFQWRRNGVDLPGATAAAFTIAAATGADAGNYSVVVRNAAGSATSQAATLAVAPAQGAAPVAPSIVVSQGNVVVAPGMGAAFGVTVQGSGPMTYRWWRNGIEVPGQTGAVYTIAAASSFDAGSYRVEISNSAGSVQSNSTQLVLLGAPAITQQPVAASATEGSSATFSVATTGDALRYQWTRNQVGIVGATGSTYTTPALALADSGTVFGVIVYNGAGLVFSQNAALTVNVAAPPASAWRTAALIDNNAATRERPQIAVEAGGNAMAVWQQHDATSGTTGIWASRFLSGDGWGAPAQIETFSGRNAVAPQVAVDGDGNAYAVWQQADSTGQTVSIWANRFDSATDRWGAAAALGVGMQPQIAVDGSGNAVAVWNLYSGAIGSVWANRFSAGTGWGTATRIETGATNSAGPPRVALDANGNALAVWNRFDGSRNNIWANRYTAATNRWATAVLIESGNAGTSEGPRIAVDANGNGLAVWSYFDGARFDIMANRYSAVTDSWDTAAISLTAGAGSGTGADIAFDTAGNAMAVWSQEDGTRYNIWANRYVPGTGWGGATLIESDNAGNASDPRIALDAAGHAGVVWSQSDGVYFNIWANRYTAGAGWGAPALLEALNRGHAGRPQIGVDGRGNAIAVWEQDDGSSLNVWTNSYR